MTLSQVKLLEKCMPADKTAAMNLEKKAERVKTILTNYSKLITYADWIAHERIKHAQQTSTLQISPESPSGNADPSSGKPNPVLESEEVVPLGESSQLDLVKPAVPEPPVDSPPLSAQDLPRLPEADSRVEVLSTEPDLEAPPERISIHQTRDLSSRLASAPKEEEPWATDCAVCLSGFSKEEKVRELVCDHIFHNECIHDWFMKAKSPACPLCRNVLHSGLSLDEMTPVIPATSTNQLVAPHTVNVV